MCKCANVTQHLICWWSFSTNFIAVPHSKLWFQLEYTLRFSYSPDEWSNEMSKIWIRSMRFNFGSHFHCRWMKMCVLYVRPDSVIMSTKKVIDRQHKIYQWNSFIPTSITIHSHEVFAYSFICRSLIFFVSCFYSFISYAQTHSQHNFEYTIKCCA